MAYLKTEEMRKRVGTQDIHAKIKINVNADGEFYGEIPKILLPLFKNYSVDEFSNRVQSNRNEMLCVYSKTYDGLIRSFRTAFDKATTPEETRVNVILYNIESHVAFAITDKGEIVPNAGYDDARWVDHEDDQKFGDHSASSRAKGGYSLTIGAKPYTKVESFMGGEKVKTKFESYYGENGDHLGNETPAEKLNSWCSFELPKDSKEMPYSDEAALFFHDLMMGMAKLSKLVQDRTFDEATLMEAIASQTPLLGYKS